MNKRKVISNTTKVYLSKSHVINSLKGRHKFSEVNYKYTNNIEK